MLTFLGILFISSLPALFVFNQQLELSFIDYYNQLFETVRTLFLSPFEMTYFSRGLERSLLSDITGPYFYSLKILGSAFLLSIILSLILSFIVLVLPKKISLLLRSTLTLLNSAPDVLIIVCLQLAVIFIYQKTQVLVFNIVSLYDDPTYMLPIICLAIPPTIYISNIVLLYLTEEFDKNYITLAKGKGISRGKIIIKHIYRNVLLNLVPHFRVHFVFILSNLIALEYIFNINGITKFLLNNGSSNPEVLTIGLLLIFYPIHFAILMIEAILKRLFNTKGEV